MESERQTDRSVILYSQIVLPFQGLSHGFSRSILKIAIPPFLMASQYDRSIDRQLQNRLLVFSMVTAEVSSCHLDPTLPFVCRVMAARITP